MKIKLDEIIYRLIDGPSAVSEKEIIEAAKVLIDNVLSAKHLAELKKYLDGACELEIKNENNIKNKH